MLTQNDIRRLLTESETDAVEFKEAKGGGTRNSSTAPTRWCARSMADDVRKLPGYWTMP